MTNGKKYFTILYACVLYDTNKNKGGFMKVIKEIFKKVYGLGSGLNFSHAQFHKSAFTLAEVLITLVVVGVISAMTIPTVINKYQEKVTVTKVKKFYSMMNQAFMLSVKDNGYANEWNVGNGATKQTAKQFAGYIKPYLKVIKDCGTNSGCLGYTENVNLLNGQKHTVNYDTRNEYYKLILSDGTYLIIRATGEANYCQGSAGGHSNACGAFFMDTNGGKQPNTIGKDIFGFTITPFAVKPNITDTCSKNNSGLSCSSYILKNGNMDYLH